MRARHGKQTCFFFWPYCPCWNKLAISRFAAILELKRDSGVWGLKLPASNSALQILHERATRAAVVSSQARFKFKMAAVWIDSITSAIGLRYLKCWKVTLLLPSEKLMMSLWALTPHNWQEWKSRFLTCSCHRIDRVIAVGLSLSNYTKNMLNLGQIRENLTFCQ